MKYARSICSVLVDTERVIDTVCPHCTLARMSFLQPTVIHSYVQWRQYHTPFIIIVLVADNVMLYVYKVINKKPSEIWACVKH